MRGAGTFVAVAAIIIIGCLQQFTSLSAPNISSFGQEENALPTLNSTPIPKPTPTPTPPPAPVPTIVTLVWDPSPDTRVIGYRLLMGTQSQNYVAKMALGNQTSVKVFINHPTTYFVVTAYNADGLESSPSGEVVIIQ